MKMISVVLRRMFCRFFTLNRFCWWWRIWGPGESSTDHEALWVLGKLSRVKFQWSMRRFSSSQEWLCNVLLEWRGSGHHKGFLRGSGEGSGDLRKCFGPWGVSLAFGKCSWFSGIKLERTVEVLDEVRMLQGGSTGLWGLKVLLEGIYGSIWGCWGFLGRFFWSLRRFWRSFWMFWAL